MSAVRSCMHKGRLRPTSDRVDEQPMKHKVPESPRIRWRNSFLAQRIEVADPHWHRPRWLTTLERQSESSNGQRFASFPPI